MNKIITLIIIVLFLSSCQSPKTTKVELIASVSELSDTLFLSQVENLTESKGLIIFSEEYWGQIIVINSKDLIIKSIVGKKGEGPNELCNLSNFCLSHDTLFVLDGGCGKLLTYDLAGHMIQRYALPRESRLMPEYRYFVNEHKHMHIATQNDTGAFVDINLNNGNLSFKGKRFEFKYDSQNTIRNGRNIFKRGNTYIMVSDNMPYIEVCDNQYNLIEKYDYTNIVQNRLSFIEKHINAPNSYGIICEDAYVNENKLYLLLASNSDGIYFVNRIAVFSLSPQIKFEKQYELPGNVYSTFCIAKDKIFAFNSQKSELEVLALSTK